MKPRPWRPTAWLTGLTVLSFLATAQVWADDDIYRVEVIVFKQEAISSDNPERWPTHPDPAVFERYAELRDDARAPGTEVYRLLTDNDMDLHGTARRLDGASAYQVLVHTAWLQPGAGRNEAAAVPLPLGADPHVARGQDDDANGERPNGDGELEAMPSLTPRPPDGLSGWVRVFRERYLHVEADLRWVEEEPQTSRLRAGLQEFLLEEMQPVVVMRERRRMRSDELHYLDHPVLGVLIHVDRVDD